MKKFMCTLLTLAMLCSFMVVNVSATNTYEGGGFRIVTDYELTLYDTEEVLGGIAYEYGYDAGDGEDDNGITLVVADCENEEAAEYADYILENCDGTTFKGYSAVITEDYRSEHDIYSYTVETLRDSVVCIIDMSAMGASNYQIMLEIVNNIEFTDEYSYIDDENNYYEEDYDDYDIESSTYWENEYFVIDTDVELFCYEDENDDGVGYIFQPFYDSDGNEIDPDVGAILIDVYFDEDYDKMSKEMADDYDSIVIDNDNVISSEYTEDKFCGFDSIMYTYEDDDGEYAGRELCILFSDEENVYYIEIESCSERDFYYDNIRYVDILFDIVENDLHFKNAPVDDEKSEDTSNKSDKNDTSKDDNSKKDTETENKDTTTIIIVAIVAGAVVILGVTAMVIFGKKKKQ